MKATGLSMFVPDELVMPLMTLGIVLGGFALTIGARRMAATLFIGSVGLALLPLFDPYVESLIGSVPRWAVAAMLVILGLVVLHQVAGFLFSRRAADQIVATLAVDFIRFLVILPLRIIQRLLRLITGL